MPDDAFVIMLVVGYRVALLGHALHFAFRSMLFVTAVVAFVVTLAQAPRDFTEGDGLAREASLQVATISEASI